MFVELIDLETKSYAIYGTALRKSKYDSEAKSGKSIRCGYFKGYKFHCIATDIIISLVFGLKTANVYDKKSFHQPKYLMKSKLSVSLSLTINPKGV